MGPCRLTPVVSIDTPTNTYICTGAITTTQNLSGTPLNVTLGSGASVDTSSSSGDAFTLTGDGGITFTQSSVSPGDITGYDYGVKADNYSGGALSVTAAGTVSGTNKDGVYAENYGTDLTINATEVTGNWRGMEAYNHGTGATSITTSGNITGGTGYDGILVLNDGGDATTINVGSASVVQGDAVGIAITSPTAHQAAILNINGEVENTSGSSSDAAVISTDGATTINLNSGGGVIGTITLGDYNDTFTLAGTLNGSATLGDGNDTFIQVGGSSLSGTIDGGAGTDTLGFDNMGTVDASVVGTTYLNFENLGFYGGSTTLTGTWDFSSGSTTVYGGSVTVDGSLTSGSLAIASGGAFNVNGTASITGATTVDGVLKVTPGGVFSGNTLTINSGGLAKIRGTATLSGATTDYGTINLDGTLTTSALTVESSGWLIGNGTINGDTNIYGIISPGHSIGELTVNGALTFQSNSTYVVQLAANGNADHIQVNGAASIHGGTIDASLEQGLYTNGTSWNILSATGGISGNFASVTPEFTSYTVSLDPQNQGGTLDLVVVRTPYASFGTSTNQQAVGGALDTLLPSATGDMANLFMDMDFAMDPAQINTTLAGLNPEMYTAFPASGLEIAGAFNRMVALRQEEAAARGDNPAHRWTTWGRLLGDRLKRDTQDGIAGYTLNTTGSVFGLDRNYGRATRVGIMFGHTSSNLSWTAAGDSGSISARHIGVYATTHIKGFRLDGSAGYTRLDNSAVRLITTPAFADWATASFSGNAWETDLSGTYAFHRGTLSFGPVLAADYQRLNQDSASESSSAGDLAVQLHDSTTESFTSSLGLQASDKFAYRHWIFLPQALLAVVHQFKNNPASLTANFINYPQAPSNVSGAQDSANTGLANLGLTAEYTKNLSVYVDLSATFAGKRKSGLITGGLSWIF